MRTSTDPSSIAEPPAEIDRAAVAPAKSEGGAAVARNALHLVAGQIALTALSFVLSGAMGRSLGPVDFGLYFFILSTTNFVYTFVDWGQSHVLLREIARRRERTGQLLGSALAIRCAGALIAAGGTFLVLSAIGYEARTVFLAALYIAIWIPSSLWMAYGLAFRAHERMGADAKVGVLNKVLTVTIILPALALGGRLVTAILAMGAAGVGALVYAVMLSRKVRFPSVRFDAASVRELLSLGAPLLLMNLLMMAQTYMEPLILSLATPAEVLGWYGAARTLANALIMPAAIIATASFPRIARASAMPHELKREFSTAARPVIALSVLVGTGTYLFAPFAVSVVYGAEGYSGAGIILQAIAPTLSLIFLNLVLSNTVLIMGNATRVAAYKVVALGVSGVLAYWLVPLAQERLGNGALGVIFAFGVSEVFMLLAFTILLPRGLLERPIFADLLRSLAAGILALGTIAIWPWKSPLLTMPLFVLAFMVSGLVLGLYSRAEIISLVRAVRRRSTPSAG